MQIHILHPGDESRLKAFLRPHVDSSMILLSNLRQGGLADHGRRFEGTYYAALSSPDGTKSIDGEITDVVAHYWQGNLVLQAPKHLEQLLEEVANAPERPIRGLLGLSDQVGRAKELLGWTDAELQLDEAEGLYALPLSDLVIPDDLRADRVRGRRIERHDLDLVTAWRVAYCLAALGAKDTPDLVDQCRAEMEGYFERGDTWILEDLELEDGGKPVASTSFNATTSKAVQIGGVWTPPELRGRGYGRTAVAASLLGVRTEGVHRAILFTGDDNIPAVKAYTALGFRRIGDHRIVLHR